jgi:hypothetical protein
MKNKYLLFLFLLGILVSCSKEKNKELKHQIQASQNAHVNLFGIFAIGYDIAANHGRTVSHSLFQKQFNIKWIDSVFNDGNGIEGILQFHNTDSISGLKEINRDGKYREGQLHFRMNAPLSSDSVQIQLFSNDTLPYFVSNNPSSLFGLKGMFTIIKLDTNRFTLNCQNLNFDYHGTKIKGQLEYQIFLENIQERRIWGTSFTVETGGKLSSANETFELSTTNKFGIRYTEGCANSFNSGEFDIKATNSSKKIVTNFNPFFEFACDKHFKITLGKEEHIEEIE